MKLVSSILITFVFSGLMAQAANTLSWEKWLDCNDGHGNELLIDVDTIDKASFQMVLRPAKEGLPSVIDYLRDNGMVYSQPSYNEIVVPVSPGIYEDFGHSDQLLTHKVNLDNHHSSNLAPETGARLEVNRGTKSVEWYFNTCKKFY